MNATRAAIVLDRLGDTSLGFFRQLGEIALLLRETLAQTVRLLGETARVADPRVRRRVARTLRLVIDQMLEFGVYSIPVASITSAAVGMVMTLETGRVLIRYLGSPLFIGGLTGFGLVRELGPVLSALMVAARMGSSITAEIGTMKVTEQIDAMKCLGENPVRYLVLPRFVAAVVMMPLLAICADTIGILASFSAATLQLDLTPHAYWDDFRARVWPEDIMHGLIKTVFFGVIVSLVACQKGFGTEGGAEGVGKACTESVVLSCISILLADYLLTQLLF